MSQTRNYTVDLFKFIASLLIIGIHTSPFSDVNDNMCFFVVHVLCRLAVPFFAVCSGFFLTKSLEKSEYQLRPIKSQEIKLIKLYVLWTVIYFLFDIPFAINGGYFTFKNYVGFAIATVTTGSHYHLWYLLSLIYALPLFYLCVKYLSDKIIILLMIFLYFIKAVSYGYIQWCPPFIANIFHFFDRISAIYDAVFLILPLLLLGHIISRRKMLGLKASVIGLVVSFLFLTFEAFLLKNLGQEKVSYIFSTFPVAYFVFSTVIQLKFAQNWKVGKILGSLSLVIYCFHSIVVELLPKDMFSLLKYAIVAIVSVIVAALYYFIMRRIQSPYRKN